jgi:hypothetical protein
MHGFHSYPARLHPQTAERIIQGLSGPGDIVVDPFCGSGTSLVAARLLGRCVFGSDLSPLAAELSWLKTLAPSAAVWAPVVKGGDQVVAFAEERRRKKAGPTHRYGKEDLDLYDIHVLLELDSLNTGIKKQGGFKQRCLALVLSALLTKVSKKAGDSSELRRSKRIAAGYTTRLFFRKLEELTQRITEFKDLLPEKPLPVSVGVSDARRLRHIKPNSVGLILGSPPYPGVYDYLSQHSLRLRWLGLKATSFEVKELGARRHLTELSAEEGAERWQRDLGHCLKEFARVLSPSGAIALVIGDGLAGGRAILAPESISRLAPRAGLEVSAIASQHRRQFHNSMRRAFSGRPREEHLVVLRPARG